MRVPVVAGLGAALCASFLAWSPAVAADLAPANAPQWQQTTLPALGDEKSSNMLDVDCVGDICHGLQTAGPNLRTNLPAHVRITPQGSTVQAIPADRGTLAEAISCAGADWCMAVGHVRTPDPTWRTWASVYDGSRWRRVPTPSPDNGLGGQAYLKDVSCTSSTWCVAVGHYFDSDTEIQGLMLRWNGERWQRIEKEASAGSPLGTIDCVARQKCVVGGNRGSFSGNVMLRRWTADGWRSISARQVAGPSAELESLDCSTLANCLAVGKQRAGNDIVGLMVRVKGRQAQAVSPSAFERVGHLYGVTCEEAGGCFAVGRGIGSFPAPVLVRVTRNDRTAVSRPVSAEFGGTLEAISRGNRLVAVGEISGGPIEGGAASIALIQTNAN